MRILDISDVSGFLFTPLLKKKNKKCDAFTRTGTIVTPLDPFKEAMLINLNEDRKVRQIIGSATCRWSGSRLGYMVGARPARQLKRIGTNSYLTIVDLAFHFLPTFPKKIDIIIS